MIETELQGLLDCLHWHSRICLWDVCCLQVNHQGQRRKQAFTEWRYCRPGKQAKSPYSELKRRHIQVFLRIHVVELNRTNILVQTSSSIERPLRTPATQPERCKARHEDQALSIERARGPIQLQQCLLLRGAQGQRSVCLDQQST